MIIKNLKKLDKPLLLITILFLIIGLLMVFSASSIVSVLGFGEAPYYHFLKQLFFVCTGSIIFLTIINIKISSYKKLIYVVLIICFGLLIYVLVNGAVRNNASSWINLKFFSFQPSEVTKIALIIFYGIHYGTNFKKMKTNFYIWYPIIITIIFFVLIFMQPDFGTSFIIASILFGVFFSLPIDKKNKLVMFILILSGVTLLVLTILFCGNRIFSETQMNRFNFLEPCTRYQEESGYQVCNGYIAINNGGLLGQGLGNSTQKYLYLPEMHTDFIFAIIVEELGIIGGVFIILLYLLLFYRILIISKKANNLTNSIIAYGVFIYILVHIIINLGGLLGILPLTGVPLPFLSYGGTFIWSLIAGISLVQRVAIESRE